MRINVTTCDSAMIGYKVKLILEMCLWSFGNMEVQLVRREKTISCKVISFIE